MSKSDGNTSDNSHDTSVDKSLSGVSIPQSFDCTSREDDEKCEIFFGNLFCKYPHPETFEYSTTKSLKKLSPTFATNDDQEKKCFYDLHKTTERSNSKTRHQSESLTRFSNKNKQKAAKGGSLSNNCSSELGLIERLQSTISRVRESRSPTVYSEACDSTSMNPDIPLPCGDIQLPIRNTTILGNPNWNDLQDILIYRAEQNSKSLFFSMLDGSGKTLSNSCLSYYKLYKKARKVCHYITTKLFSKNGDSVNLRPGQSVGLVFDTEDPFDFLIGFFACMLAKVIAVIVEKPSVSQISASIHTRKYLNQFGISVVLTNSSSFKDLTRKTSEIKEHVLWPDMLWVQIDSLYNEKVSKGFMFPEACTTFNAPLYVEYVYADQSILRGVPVSMESTLNHCHALNSQCEYKEGQSVLCTDDLRRQTGLWHCVLTSLYCGTSCIYMPYPLVRRNPLSWLLAITKNKISGVVTSSRILHHCLGVEAKDLNSVNLSSLENLVVSDACVPWINETLERFLRRFINNGLRESSIITSVSRSETLTICMRRRKDADSAKTTSLKLCLESLSYDMIREADSDSYPSAVFVESSGHLLPTMRAILVQLDDHEELCRQDEIGEICVMSPFSNRGFWMTPDGIAQSLKITPDHKDYSKIFKENVTFNRTGLVGFFRKIDGLDHIYVQGSVGNFVEVNGRRFNCDDIIGTVSVVKPLGILYRARCCVFTVPVLDHGRIVIIVEVNTSEYSNSKIYDWTSNVLQAVLNFHQVNVYCIAAIPSNTFAKSLLGDINIAETRSRFILGTLNISHLTLCPQTAIPNLPSMNRDSEYCSKSANLATISGMQLEANRRLIPLPEILDWRSSHTPTQPLVSIINTKLSIQESLNCQQLHRRAERVCSLLKEKLKNYISGSTVAIMLVNPIEVMAALYGCHYAGLVPLFLPLLANETSWTPFHLTEHLWACIHSKAVACLTSSANIRYLKSKECGLNGAVSLFPLLIDILELPKKKPTTIYNYSNPEKELALISLHIDQTGVVTLPAWSHAQISTLAEAHKTQNDLTPDLEVSVCMDMTTITGVFLNCILPLYCGYHCFVIPASVMDTNADCWLEFVSRGLIKHSFGSELALSQTVFAAKYSESCSFYKKPGLNLKHVVSFVICTNERPNHELIKEFLLIVEESKFGLQTLSIGIDCPWTPGYFMQITKEMSPYSVYLEKDPLRSCRISESLVASLSCIAVVECGAPLPGGTVLIVDSTQQCHRAVNQIGELWLSSNYNSRHIIAVASSKQLEDLYRDELEVTKSVCDSDTRDIYADNILAAKLVLDHSNSPTTLLKTGLVGYIRSSAEFDNTLVVLGRLDDVINLRGFCYFCSEIESLINQVDTSFINKSVVFVESELLIAVIETVDLCTGDICLRLLPKLVKSVLESSFLPLGIIQFVKFGEIDLSWGSDRRKVKSLWIRRKMNSHLQFYCL